MEHGQCVTSSLNELGDKEKGFICYRTQHASLHILQHTYMYITITLNP